MNPAATLKHWGTLNRLGAMNLLNVGPATYAWDTAPREQKNGAVIGRVYVQRPGEVFRDIGHYKIAADGSVVEVPEVLREFLVAAPPEPLPVTFTMDEIEAAP